MSNRRNKIIQLSILIGFIVILVMITMQFVPLFKGLITEEGRETFQNTLEELGPLGAVVLIGIMVAQVLLPILPGEPVELIAGMCYGALGGVIIITIGAFISSTIIFFAVRKFGEKFIYAFVSEKKIEEMKKSKWFNNTKKIEIIFLILFLLPGMPKDLLVYVGGLTPVKAIHFIAISTFARIPAVLTLATIGGNIMEGEWKSMLVVAAISIAITAALVYVICKKGNISKKDIE